MQDTLHGIVRKMEEDFKFGNTKLSRYVNHSISETLEKVYAYLNSTHTTGKYDSQDQEKPFFNIVVAAANIWFRATDIDRKNIKIRATKQSQWLDALIATAKIQDWMRRTRYGAFLNDWGRVLSRYGSAPLKFVRNSKGLSIQVIQWSHIICDAVDFDSNPKIELMELTEGELRKRIETHGYSEEAVEQLVEAAQVRETRDRIKKDNKSGYFKLYEIHGLLSKKLLTGNESDKNKFVQQMHVISFIETGRGRQREYADFTLIKGEEEKDPYMITHLIKEDDRTLSIGAVEYLFDAQWMQNHSVLAMKKQLDLASKLIFQTADQSFVGRNALNDIENGDIMVHQDNRPLTQINNGSHDLVSWQNYAVQWKSLGNEIVGISDAMLGAAPKAGTAWRQTEALLEESHSLFELMTENKGFYIEDMFRNWIIPYIVETELDTAEEIMAVLDAHDIQRVDKRYVHNAAVEDFNAQVVDNVTKGVVSNLNLDQMKQDMQASLQELGNERSFIPSKDIALKTWKKHWKDLEWDLEIDVTGEQQNVQEAMTTLNSALKMVLTPGYDENPKAQMIVGKILELSGAMSPVEVQSMPSQPKQRVDGNPPAL